MSTPRRPRRSRRPFEEGSSDDEDDTQEQSIEEFTASSYRNLLRTLRRHVLAPFLIGVAGAFGVSVGYALFDYVAVHAHGWKIPFPRLQFQSPIVAPHAPTTAVSSSPIPAIRK